LREGTGAASRICEIRNLRPGSGGRYRVTFLHRFGSGARFREEFATAIDEGGLTIFS